MASGRCGRRRTRAPESCQRRERGPARARLRLVVSLCLRVSEWSLLLTSDDSPHRPRGHAGGGSAALDRRGTTSDRVGGQYGRLGYPGPSWPVGVSGQPTPRARARRRPRADLPPQPLELPGRRGPQPGVGQRKAGPGRRAPDRGRVRADCTDPRCPGVEGWRVEQRPAAVLGRVDDEVRAVGQAARPWSPSAPR